jgi:hypothetical protein
MQVLFFPAPKKEKPANKIAAFFNRPKLIEPTFKSPVQLHLINEDSSEHSIAHCLGISLEREKELEDISHECRKKEPQLNDAELLVKVSTKCNHQQELAFVAYHLGACPYMRIANPLARR